MYPIADMIHGIHTHTHTHRTKNQNRKEKVWIAGEEEREIPEDVPASIDPWRRRRRKYVSRENAPVHRSYGRLPFKRSLPFLHFVVILRKVLNRASIKPLTRHHSAFLLLLLLLLLLLFLGASSASVSSSSDLLLLLIFFFF